MLALSNILITFRNQSVIPPGSFAINQISVLISSALLKCTEIFKNLILRKHSLLFYIKYYITYKYLLIKIIKYLFFKYILLGLNAVKNQ